MLIAAVVWAIEDSNSTMSDGVEIQITPLSSPVSSTSKTNPSGEKFQGGCPPDNAMTPEEIFMEVPPQKIDPRLLDFMEEVAQDDLGEDRLVAQERAFCLFTDDGRVKGLLNHYYARLGQRYANPIDALAFWMSKRKIDLETICQIEWVWSEPPCKPPDDTKEESPAEEQEPDSPRKREQEFA
jgi:hypothetical protein